MAPGYYPETPVTPGFSPSYQPYGGDGPVAESSSPGLISPGSSKEGKRTNFKRANSSLEPFIYEVNSHASNSGLNGPQRAKSDLKAFVLNWWLCIVSLVLSALALGAIIILLVIVDGKALPKLPLSITVNTYVSFFGTIAKASMLVAVAESISQLKWLWFRQPRTLEDMQLFDDASRGPFGAVRLILKTKGMKLAALGSLVMILSLVMDPFAQQIVSYPSRNIVAGQAVIGTSQTYDAGIDLDSSLGVGLLEGPEWGMKAAFYDGIFKPSTANDVAPDCPTGNCTFPLFDTLAVCSKCVDVSNQVVVNNPPTNPSTLQGIQTVSYSIPGGATTNFSVLFQDGNLIQGPAIITTTNVPSTLSQSVIGVQNPLLMLIIYQFPSIQQRILDGNYYTKPPMTNECALYFCINTYNLTVSSGVPNSTILATWVPDTGTPTTGDALSPNGMSGTHDAIFVRPDDAAHGNHTYSIAAGTLANLKAWLNVTMQGSINTTFSQFPVPIWANDQMQVLNSTSDWSSLFHALSTAMTTYIRSPSRDFSTYTTVTGTAYKTETFIHVIWAWMALPCGLVALSVVFLAATMTQNEGKSALAWKSSSLALLFHGLEGVGGGADGVEQMRRVARGTRVVLDRGSDGEWKLINTG